MSGLSRPWFVAALIWTLAVLTINSISVRDATWRPLFAGADKLAHALMYGVAAYTWRRAVRSSTDRVSWLIVIGIAALGALDEWHQRWVPGRSADVFDWLADAAGAAVAMVVWRGLHARRDAVA